MKRQLAAVVAVVAAVVIALTLILSGGGASQSAGGSVHPPGWGKPAPRTYSLSQSGPTASMFDSTTPSAFPPSPFAFAGYTAGAWPNYLGLVRAYPHAHAVSIAIAASLHARCLDAEPGDATPSEAAAWVRADIQAGFAKPCVYSSYWEFVNQVRPALAAGGIARSSVWEWDASYTGRPGITPSFDATQYTDKAFGRNLDESTVSLAFLGVSPKPKPLLPKCYSHRESRAECSKAKAQVERARRAESSSNGAYDIRDCHLFAGRIQWFSSRLTAHPKFKTTSRRRALAASRSAYRQRSCAVYRRRADFFATVVGRVEAAN